MDQIVKDVNEHCRITGTSRAKLFRDAGVSRGAWAGWVKGGGITRESIIRLDEAMRADRQRIQSELGGV